MTQEEFHEKYPYLSYDFDAVCRDFFLNPKRITSTNIPLIAEGVFPEDVRDAIKYSCLCSLSCIFHVPPRRDMKIQPVDAVIGAEYDITTLGAIVDDAFETARPYMQKMAQSIVNVRKRMGVA